MKFFATFKQSSMFRKNFVQFEAKDKQEAISLIEKNYDRYWSMLYSEEGFEGQIEGHKLTEIPFGATIDKHFQRGSE